MKQKRVVTLLLVFLFTLSNCMSAFGGYVYAAETKPAAEKDRYYYDQLTSEGKGFYDAMYQMYTKDIFKTGTESYDLVANGHVTQEQLDGYAAGNTQLIHTMGAARDAFYADYPDIFYVDFSYLSIRVTQDASENYHAYLGPGRSNDYYLTGFKSKEQVEDALEKYEAKVNEIVKGAKELEIKEEENLIEQQIKYVHDTIINNTSYRLENTCTKGNEGHVRTAYGALVMGESLCEGYSRAMKAVLDRLGIPCVLVQGVYRASDMVSEPHMWNYVQVDGKWYAVDATMDDPVVENKKSIGIDGKENSYYLLVGEDVMSRRHVPDGNMSDCGFEFQYPQLVLDGLGIERVSGDNGSSDLVVKYNPDGIMDGVKAGEYKISYQGMGYRKAAEQGKYMLMRFYAEDKETSALTCTDWGYLDPDVFPILQDTDTELTTWVAQSFYVEFAVTDLMPRYLNTDEEPKPEYLSYQGDPLLVEDATGMLYNPSGTYVKPPYVKTITPSVSARLYMEDAYHVSAAYDEKLTASGTGTPGATMDCTGPTGVKYGKITNFSFDGDRTVSFDFKPSDMWADESVFYNIHINGLVGETSGKVPNVITYFVGGRRTSHCSLVKDYNWSLYGKPSLLEEKDLSVNGWQTSDGNPVSDQLKDRLVLVATTPTHKQTGEMMDMLESKYPNEQILKSETYNISLTACKQQIVKTGEGVRVSLGFPEGYGPENAGTTFKAYHFIQNDAGVVTGVEEIPCTVTQYGIVILCKSFSPFAIVAVKDTGETNDTSKTVLLAKSKGGTVAGADSIFTLASGQSRTLTVKADMGYVIDEIVAGGKIQYGEGKKSDTVRVNYSGLPDGSSFIEVKFVAETVYKNEAARGETLVQPSAEPAEITMKTADISVTEGSSFSIAPEITEKSKGIHTYQWYKDGKLLTGQTGKQLSVSNAAKSDAGAYVLKITTTVNALSVVAEGEACNVTLKTQSGNQSSGSSAVFPAAPAASVTITMKDQQLSVAENSELTIAPEIKEYGGTHVYQWYRDGVSIAGQTDKILYIKSVSKKDAGIYTLIVTTYSGTESVKTVSAGCQVTVTDAVDTETEEKPQTSETAPGIVTDVQAVSTTADSVDLTWKALSGADGYEVLRYDASQKKLFVIAAVKETSYTDHNLTAGKAYRYKVRAYKETNGKTLTGTVSDVVKIIVKPATPKQVSVKRLSGTSAQISFMPSKNATGYRIYKYDAQAKKFRLTYRVQSGKLYQYNEKTAKWKAVRKTGLTSDGAITCKLTGLDLSDAASQKYRVSALVVKSGYKSQVSKVSKTVTVKK